jgi:HK97 family phage major capsid protein
MVHMDYERLSTLTADQLTLANANDFVRLVALQKQFAGDPNAKHLAFRNFPVHYPRSLNVELFSKAAVAAATTTDSTWAGPLSPIRPLMNAFVALLRPRTLLGRIPGLRAVPANVSVAAQTTGGTYGWVGQGASVPATKSDFATVTVPATKCGGIVGISQELAELSTPAAIDAMREEMVAGCSQFLDTQFVDPAVAVSAGVSPASITNGAGTTASAGTSAANALTDVQVLVTQITTANPSIENLVILSTPANAYAVAKAANSNTLGLNGGTYYGIPWITSGSVGARLIALDASQILVADDGGLNVDVSTSALVQFDSAPADPTVASTVLISLFQKNLVGLKITRMVTWKRVASTAVYYISAAAYV